MATLLTGICFPATMPRKEMCQVLNAWLTAHANDGWRREGRLQKLNFEGDRIPRICYRGQFVNETISGWKGPGSATDI